MLNLIDEKGKKYGAIAEVKETNGVNGERSLAGTIYTNDEVIDGIDRGWQILWKGEKYYIIFSMPVDLGETVEVQFDAVHQFFYDFSKSAVEEQLSDGSHTIQAYLNFIFKNSGYSFRLDTQVNAFKKQSFGYKNRLALFNDVIKSAGVEFTVNGNVVRIINRVGNDLSTIVKKGFNLNELKIEKNIGDFITHMTGFGKWNDEEDHAKGRLTASYTSPLAEIYGKRDGDPVVDERYTNKENLIARLKEEVENSYNISVTIDMEDLTRAGYEYKQPRAGDSIMAINEDLNFGRKIRIISYTSYYDTNDELIKHEVSCNSVSMAQASTSNQSGLQKQLDQIKEQLKLTNQTANHAMVSADGKNNIFYGDEKPDPNQVKLTIGDLWFDTSGEDTVMYIWNGVEWRIGGYDPEAQKRLFAEVEQKVKQLEQEQSASQAKSDAILQGLGVKPISESAQDIITDINNRFESIELSDTDKQALQEAKTAIEEARELLANQDKAISETITAKLDVLEDKINAKVDKTVVDSINQTVKSHTTTLQQHADSIMLKAEQSLVAAMNQNLNKSYLEIEANANEIKKRLTKSEVDNLIDGKGYATTTSLNQVKNTADGNEALIAKIQETPATYLADYQKLINRADLFDRTLGTTDSEVGDSVSRMVQTSGIIQTEVAEMDLATNTELTSKISQLADNIDLKVSSDELLSQINVQAGSVLIQSGTNKLNITPETTYIEDATIKSAMIESIEADKITAGTLDAGKVRVINLDANNITANKTSFVQSAWNSIESSIRIDSGGLLSTASDGSQVYIQNGIMGVRNAEGISIGQIGYVYDGDSPTYTIRTTWGASFAIKQTFYDSYTGTTKNKRALDMYTTDDGYSETVIRMSRIVILGDAHVSFHFRHAINGNDQNRLMVNGAESVALRARDSTVFVVSNNGKNNSASLYTNLNMQGYTVRNTSDIRLKRDIVNDEIDSLSALMKWQHAGFNYIDPNMNQERQFSVVAQSAPDIAFADEDGYLQVSLNKQVNMTSHALQQHVIKTNDEITRLKAQIASLQDELALLKGA